MSYVRTAYLDYFRLLFPDDFTRDDKIRNGNFKVCAHCETYIPPEEERKIGQTEENVSIYCGKCHDNSIFDCTQCGDEFSVFEPTSVNTRQGRFCCIDCADDYENENTDSYDDENNTWYAQHSRLEGVGFTLVPNRTFGVELETSHWRGSPRAAISKYFSGEEDGSIDGIEMVSCILKGDEAFDVISGCVESARSINEAHVDSHCGYHLHVCVNDFDVNDLNRLLWFTRENEDLFFSMMPYSRQKNTYCLRYRDLHSYNNGLDMRTKETLVCSICHEDMKHESRHRASISYARGRDDKHWANNRYCWVNFAAIPCHTTIEIRLHNGTLNAQKINNWVILWVNIIEQIKQKKLLGEIYTLHNIIATFNIPDNKKTELEKFFTERIAKFANKHEEETEELVENV